MYRIAQRDSKSPADTLSFHSTKRSFVDLTGDDEGIDKPKNKRLDTTIEKKRSFDHRLKIIEQPNARRIDTNTTNSTFQNAHRIADQPREKIKPLNNHEWSDSGDELETSEADLYSATNAVKGALKYYVFFFATYLLDRCSQFFLLFSLFPLLLYIYIYTIFPFFSPPFVITFLFSLFSFVYIYIFLLYIYADGYSSLKAVAEIPTTQGTGNHHPSEHSKSGCCHPLTTATPIYKKPGTAPRASRFGCERDR